MLYATTGQRE